MRHTLTEWFPKRSPEEEGREEEQGNWQACWMDGMDRGIPAGSCGGGPRVG